LEELLQAEITDETDTWEETGSRRGPRREERGVGMSLFEHKVKEDRHVSVLTAPAARLWRHVRARCAIMQLTPGTSKVPSWLGTDCTRQGTVAPGDPSRRQLPVGLGGRVCWAGQL
jgi:hypothetical protein